MKHFLLLFILISHYAVAQNTSAWNKTYSGIILDVTSNLKGTTHDGTWTATIDAQGYVYNLEGKINGNSCTGQLTDNSTGGTIPFTALANGNKISLTLTFSDPSTGASESYDIVFTEAGGNDVAQKDPVRVGAENLDRALIGQWRRTETYVSGDFSFATDYFVQFNPDGTAAYTDGKSAGGGSSSSIVTQGGDSYQIEWKTENNVLYAKDPNGAWVPYARYYVEGNSLLVTFDDGSKQIWERL